MSIRIAVIEVSHWHSLKDAAYLTHLAEIPEADVVAIQDPDENLCRRVAEEAGIRATYTDYRQMLKESKPDFVLALGRPSEMAETAHYLLDQGYPFLMEKPMGLGAEEVLGIAEKAEAKSAFAAVPFFMRYLPFVGQAQKMIADGSFGTLSHFYARNNRPTSDRYGNWGSPWMLDPAVAGGGTLRNLGLHGLDMFLYLMDEGAAVTGAQISGRALGKAVEDYASVLLRSESGVLATVEVGNIFPQITAPANLQTPWIGTDAEYKLSGSDALLTFKDGVLRVTTKEAQELVEFTPGAPPAYRILKDTLTRWQRGAAPLASARDCYRAVELADAAYRLAGQPG
ncbi:MAG: Gfo/Idh/MocA family oxidoreductase [Rhodospirillales bacterium]